MYGQKGQDAQRKTLPEQKATARFSAEQDSQMMTSFEAEQNAEEEEDGTRTKEGNGPRRQIHPIRSEKQSEMALLPRSHSLPFATDVVRVIFFTLAECTLSCYGEEGGTGASSQEQDSVARSSSRGPSEAKGVCECGRRGARAVCVAVRCRRRVCGVGEKSGRKCWSVYNEAGWGSVQSPTRFLRSSRTSANQHATRRPANPVTLRTRLVKCGRPGMPFGSGARPILAVGGRFVRLSEELTVSVSSFHQFQNRRMPQQLCGHILNINLRHVQSGVGVASASAGQRRATRERSGLVFANFSGIRCLLASPDCRIDPAGSVPLVSSLVCGRFVDELDFGFTTHGASEQGTSLSEQYAHSAQTEPVALPG
ncbi:hypothetical protein BLNAU_24418 [Blattamonas nauphoetae]|uniref:Uncharacterized protein n=1 Tax=Blattamonas nauphoetae TaxID=2049346 RepID=A0ABQ9WMH3_9EUKA|nr:hypothetical protein BLNAU_24418 [Blattamonas nauphoetae]